jgi:hypothetical protein
MTKNQDQTSSGRQLRWYHVLLLLLPFVGLLWPPFYARWTPEIFGMPFFYAYQFAWVLISSALTGLVYRSTR